MRICIFGRYVLSIPPREFRIPNQTGNTARFFVHETIPTVLNDPYASIPCL